MKSKLARLPVIALLLTLSTSALPHASNAARAEDEVNKPVADKWAVVVGISKFADGTLDLRYPAKDAQDFYDYLVTKGNFAKDHVKLLLNEKATRDRIRDVLGDSWLPRAALPDDLVVIFISSHGSSSELDIGGVNYIVAHDTNPNKLFTTGIPMSQLAGIIKERVHSNRVLVVLDTCHAGGAAARESKGLTRRGNADAQALSQGTGQMVICSSDTNQVSWEGKNYKNSVFTRTLIDSLSGARAPVAEVFNTVKDKVLQTVVQERGVMQTPQMEASKWTGRELVLDCVPAKPRAAYKELVEEDYAPVETLSDKPARPALAHKDTVVATLPRATAAPVKTQSVTMQTTPTESALKPASGANPRMSAGASPVDFMRYHFRMVGAANYDEAWQDLGSLYRAKFGGSKTSYQASVSRHKWLSYNAPDSEFRVISRPGGFKVRVRMNSLTGFKGVWVYDISVKNGFYAIENVGTSSQPLEGDD